jgi:ankyrin repeat protein
MLKILIDAKANIHLKASNELNPILYSVLMNKKQTIFYLLQNVKVDINQTTSKGFSLLSLAVYYSDIETCDFLLKKGSSKNIKLTDGRSLIDIANERKDEKMTKYIKKL